MTDAARSIAHALFRKARELGELEPVTSDLSRLAGIESVRGVRGIAVDAMPPPDPEAVRDAKGALSDRMDGSRGYVATDDLPAFFEAVDLDLVASRSASFEKFRRDLTSLAGA